MWFANRVTGRSKQHIIEAGVVRELDEIAIGKKAWTSFWHVDEGMRMIAFLFCKAPELRLTADEEAKLHFIELHYPFFFDNDDKANEERVRVLWPHIDELVAKWNKTKGTDPTHAGSTMAVLLKERGRKVPKEWIEYAALRPA